MLCSRWTIIFLFICFYTDFSLCESFSKLMSSAGRELSPSKVAPSNADTTEDFKLEGASQPLCNMFGCDCIPPLNARCCIGYKYDDLSNKCRPVV